MFKNADSRFPPLGINSSGLWEGPVICIFNKHSDDCKVDWGPQIKLPREPTLPQRFACTKFAGKRPQDQVPW